MSNIADFGSEIRKKMQVPNRLSLTLTEFSSNEDTLVEEIPRRIVIKGSNKSNELYSPFDPCEIRSRPSLEPPPESLVLDKIDYPDIDRLKRRELFNESVRASSLSLFRNGNSSIDGEDATLIVDETAQTNNSSYVTHMATFEAQLQEMSVRVTAIELALERQKRIELLAFLLVGTYFILKLSRSLLND